MGRIKPDLFYFVGSASVLIVALYFNALAFHRAWLEGNSRAPDSYSYTDDDYPASLIPFSSLPFDSSMIVEDTYHYSSSSKDEVERESLFPNGGGIVRLGPDHRPFEITMYHQIRCLNMLQKAMVTEPKDVETRSSISNCFNYIRQTLMCAASIRVEPFKPDPVIGSDKVDGLDLQYKCRDWSKIREAAEQNYRGWPEHSDAS